MTTISDTLRNPAGVGVGGVVVRAALVAASEVLAGGGAIIREAETTTASDGTWSLTLTPISSLAVSEGAYYLVTADGHRWAIDVPDSGTYALDDVQVEPDPLPSLGLTTATGVALNPPLSGGVYVGNVAIEPPPAGGSGGKPWLSMVRSHSADDSNPDTLQIRFAKNGAPGTTFRGLWINGNGELRVAPSAIARIGLRVFESYVDNGGASTGVFAAFSTNPNDPGERENLFGMYGTAHPTKAGWAEFTRVASALLGLAAGGSYPAGAPLGQCILRGFKATVGAPTAGTYIANDVVLAADGLYLCTVGGTPGTWVALPAPTAFTDVTPGTNVDHGTVHAGVRRESAGYVGRLQGSIVMSGSVSSGATAFTLPAGYRPTTTQVCVVRVINPGGNDAMTINAADGTCTFNSGKSAGNEVVLGGITFPI